MQFSKHQRIVSVVSFNFTRVIRISQLVKITPYAVYRRLNYNYIVLKIDKFQYVDKSVEFVNTKELKQCVIGVKKKRKIRKQKLVVEINRGRP